ncbi:hypothetical protein HRbin28_02160 [bacterium HR28]|nr:hypothetical protein HRbin28_02160 [bacterium HR28]
MVAQPLLQRGIRIFYHQLVVEVLAEAISAAWKRISGEVLDPTDARHLASIALREEHDQAWVVVGSAFRAAETQDYHDEELLDLDAEILTYRLVDKGYLG